MATKTPEELKTAEDALHEYGFERGGDGNNIFFKPTSNTESWIKVEGGYHCLAPVGTTSPVIGAEPWGRPYGDSGRLQVPYTQTDKYAGVSGLHPATHPEAFEWVWPEERVREIHAYAYTAEGDKAAYGRRWKRNDQGELVQDRSPLHPEPSDAGNSGVGGDAEE